MNELELYNDTVFDSIKHIDEYGNEYWLARELMTILQYSNWQNFEKIINKSIIACKNSNFNVIDHFIDVSKMVAIGSGASLKDLGKKCFGINIIEDKEHLNKILSIIKY